MLQITKCSSANLNPQDVESRGSGKFLAPSELPLVTSRVKNTCSQFSTLLSSNQEANEEVTTYNFLGRGTNSNKNNPESQKISLTAPELQKIYRK